MQSGTSGILCTILSQIAPTNRDDGGFRFLQAAGKSERSNPSPPMTSDILKKRFTELYNDEADSIYRFCFLRTSDREVAIDLMQDTFMRFWETLSRDDEIRSGRAFLFTIARNKIIDWYRRKKSLSLEALTEKAGMEGELFSDMTRKEEIEMAHEAKFLVERIRELDPQYQQVVYFRFVEDLKPKEIAEILEIPVNLVSVRIHRGIRQLRTLAGYDEE